MTAQQTDYGLVFFFSAEELHRHSLQPSLITREDALRLIRSVTEHVEDALPPCPEIQVFSARSGILLFVRTQLSQCATAGFSSLFLS
ncbi:MAG: hypothetical protein H6Q61_203 [Firmicutes bacterium]|nr:hypothetical protein [Bacillota bacterium]